jgi:hypothetical protein
MGSNGQQAGGRKRLLELGGAADVLLNAHTGRDKNSGAAQAKTGSEEG